MLSSSVWLVGISIGFSFTMFPVMQCNACTCIYMYFRVIYSSRPPSSLNMPTKMAKYYKGKPVFISVYVEKTRRRRVSSKNQHHHHHHHHHHHLLHRSINQEVIHDQYKNGGSGKGCNRRAELLRYSQSLRDSAGSAASTTLLLPKPIPPPNNQQPTTSNAIAVHRNRNHGRTPTCLGNWRILIPNFIRSFITPKDKKEMKKRKKQSGSTTNKMKALIKGFEVQKKRTSITKLLSAFRKRR
ncbi:hypothetical protein ACOSP7_025415 [Xanthoceras sorbifolium]